MALESSLNSNNPPIVPVQKSLVHGFLEAAATYPDNLALHVGGESYTYRDLFKRSALLSCLFQKRQASSQYVAILCQRKSLAFQAVLASLFSAKAYVPFDLNLEPEKLLDYLSRLSCGIVIVDQVFYSRFNKELEELPPTLIVHAGDLASVEDTKHDFVDSAGLSQFFPEQALAISNMVEQSSISAESLFAVNNTQEIEPAMLAYVLFTSGSTGTPKAVPISHENICFYIAEISHLYPVYPEDRCTQAFEFGFDPSVHDMFVTWFNGASLYVMDERARLGAHYFIRKYQISVWNSIPSLVKLCLSMRSFNATYLSSLRRVFFNGEALHVSVVQALQQRIPSAELINLYGLTETTVNLSHYHWQGEASLPACDSGVVPIGELFSNISLLQAKDTDLEQLDKEAGKQAFELFLSGAQIFSGYLDINQESSNKNTHSFTHVDNKRFFKTGDLVYQDENGCLHIQGRNDEQIKVRGKWVDLNSLRDRLESLSDCLDALVLSYKNSEDDIKLVGFLQGESFDASLIQEQVNQSFSSHMHLEKIIVLDSYPYLPSGKVDKQALKSMLV